MHKFISGIIILITFLINYFLVVTINAYIALHSCLKEWQWKKYLIFCDPRKIFTCIWLLCITQFGSIQVIFILTYILIWQYKVSDLLIYDLFFHIIVIKYLDRCYQNLWSLLSKRLIVVIEKRDSCYQKAWSLLSKSLIVVIKKCDRCYQKLLSLLSKNCDRCYQKAW